MWPDLRPGYNHHVTLGRIEWIGKNTLGAADPKLAEVAREEKRALVSLDLDFANIRVYPPHEYPGNIVLRLKQQDRPHVLQVCRRLLTVLSEESLKGYLWIVEEDRIRIRGPEESNEGRAT